MNLVENIFEGIENLTPKKLLKRRDRNFIKKNFDIENIKYIEVIKVNNKKILTTITKNNKFGKMLSTPNNKYFKNLIIGADYPLAELL